MLLSLRLRGTLLTRTLAAMLAGTLLIPLSACSASGPAPSVDPPGGTVGRARESPGASDESWDSFLQRRLSAVLGAISFPTTEHPRAVDGYIPDGVSLAPFEED